MEMNHDGGKLSQVALALRHEKEMSDSLNDLYRYLADDCQLGDDAVVHPAYRRLLTEWARAARRAHSLTHV
jgi:hypothetical protein